MARVPARCALSQATNCSITCVRTLWRARWAVSKGAASRLSAVLAASAASLSWAICWFARVMRASMASSRPTKLSAVGGLWAPRSGAPSVSKSAARAQEIPRHLRESPDFWRVISTSLAVGSKQDFESQIIGFMSVESLSINQSGRQKSGRRAQQNGCDNNKPRPAQGSIFEAKDRRARVMPDKKHQHQQDRAEQSGPQPQGQPTGEGRAAKLGAWRAKKRKQMRLLGLVIGQLHQMNSRLRDADPQQHQQHRHAKGYQPARRDERARGLGRGHIDRGDMRARGEPLEIGRASGRERG